MTSPVGVIELKQDEDPVNLIDIILVLAQFKRLLMLLPLLTGLLGGIYAFVTPKIYEAKVLMMPPQQQQSGASAMLAQLGGLAGMAGGALGLKNPSDLYVGVLQSDSIAERLVRRFNLMEVYDREFKVEAVEKLNKVSNISAGKDSLITITVMDEDPKRAANLANAYVEELRLTMKTLALTEAGQRRMYLEEQLKEAKNALAESEVAMKRMQEKTGVLDMDAQGKATIEALAALRGQIAAKQVQINALKSFATESNPDLVRARSELSALQGQLAQLARGQDEEGALIVKSKAPEVGMEYIRAVRDVKYNETLFEILAKQYEMARMDEASQGALIQVIDPATPPEKKAKPKRALILLISMFAGFFLAVMIAFLRAAWANAKSGPEADKIRQLGLALRGRAG